ncbi:MAG TPA: zinc ribbon domain-containing protein [Ktedonobacteraceae bacterium]|nr:zinc ribbon domain-containing protein [Ktedonobacteraceae bacterium]
MRCPYCGGFNKDQAPFCVYCGRDLPSESYNQPASRAQSRQAPQPQARPAAAPQPPYQQPRQVPGPPGRRPAAASSTAARQPAPVVPQAPPPPPAPEPPAPFPPRTVAELKALEPGALPYNVVDSAIGDGGKKIVRITYARAVPWQQAATLLKAFKEQQEERFNSIIIQGVTGQDTTIYSFTQGQLTFDRNVRLGSMTTNRYLIETGNGYESDSVRIVLNE